ncbi:LOW QUALITY PROTEIN: olfactory receptor 14A16-like [Herpailurus yagouaroundi]|uniref:LOW QUALITY PROTEIN: olfactory receptor 14A16-like n=1 Tax=Herpailurus yagouaroundi TaxID=1608482 RepID=UPI001AD7E4D7|nr:LOW QUALITY PROTEIN: olfactory receptor 14A16-like [Puma yagouaroundi]
MNNISVATEFLILGFSGPWSLQFLQCVLFTVIYLFALRGNGLIITITSLDPCLHTPMYFFFFLKNLSLLDICLISAVVPKTVANSLTRSNSISFFGCVTQVFLVPFSAGAELFLLTLMSVDHYAAICHLLHYEAIMNRGTCVQTVALSWLTSGFISVIHTAGNFSLSYCGFNEIQQFFCDIPQLLAIICSENITVEIVLILVNAVLDVFCFICITVSYICIFYTVRKIPSMKRQSKTYSTRLPYLAVVILFLSTAFIAYLKPILGCTSFTDLVLSSFYILLPPSHNPIIYSLRNKAIKSGLGKLIPRRLLRKENVLNFLQE